MHFELNVSMYVAIYHLPTVQFHSCAWECAFGRDVGFSPENALALHLEHPTVEPEIAGAVPHPWKPDDILEDFQEFWDNMDSLNEML